MHSFIEILFQHIEPIIMGLSILTISLAGFYFIYNVFFAKTEPHTPKQNLEELEVLLKRVLSQAEGIGQRLPSEPSFEGGSKRASEEGAKSSETSGVASSVEVEKVKNLQSELKSKQEEIEKLKMEIESKGSSAEPSADLLAKISELEARLSEYEIIEDDIADLSKYKDENAKLKEQLAKIQSGETIVEDMELTDDGVEGVDSSIQDTDESISGDKKSRLNDDELSAERDLSNEGDKGDPITDDLISEFEQAVNEQLGRPSSGEEPPGIALATEVGQEVEIVDSKEYQVRREPEIVDTQADVDSLLEKAANEEAELPQLIANSEENSQGADDIFGEFVPNEEVLTKEVNTDKMLEEMSNLASLKSDGVMSLDEDFDVDKMAKEAQTLGEKGSS